VDCHEEGACLAPRAPHGAGVARLDTPVVDPIVQHRPIGDREVRSGHARPLDRRAEGRVAVDLDAILDRPARRSPGQPGGPVCRAAPVPGEAQNGRAWPVAVDGHLPDRAPTPGDGVRVHAAGAPEVPPIWQRAGGVGCAGEGGCLVERSERPVAANLDLVFRSARHQRPLEGGARAGRRAEVSGRDQNGSRQGLQLEPPGGAPLPGHAHVVNGPHTPEDAPVLSQRRGNVRRHVLAQRGVLQRAGEGALVVELDLVGVGLPVGQGQPGELVRRGTGNASVGGRLQRWLDRHRGRDGESPDGRPVACVATAQVNLHPPVVPAIAQRRERGEDRAGQTVEVDGRGGIGIDVGDCADLQPVPRRAEYARPAEGWCRIDREVAVPGRLKQRDGEGVDCAPTAPVAGGVVRPYAPEVGLI